MQLVTRTTYNNAGYLLSRKRNNSAEETFGYDSLDRLVSVSSGGEEAMSIVYAPNGNIISKTGIGNYEYDSTCRPHAVTAVDNTGGRISGRTLDTAYNGIGRIRRIDMGRMPGLVPGGDISKDSLDHGIEPIRPLMSGIPGGISLPGGGLDAAWEVVTLPYAMDIGYGPDGERWHSSLTNNGREILGTVYAGDYEKVTDHGVTREFYYLDANTIVIRQDGVFRQYVAFTDNLGSILAVVDEDGSKVFEATYDAWGRQTVTLNTIGLQRGYCGHEMLSRFGLINMNGRLYDPDLGRFLSPDNYVQMPDNSQNFNRYSYCLNNPLKYTDPTGEFWHLVIGAAIGGVFNWATHGFQFNAKGLGYFTTGAVAGAISTGVASGINVAMAGGSFWSGAAGLAQGVASTGFWAGAAAGASAGFAGGFILGAGNSWVEGKCFGSGLLNGLKSGGINALEGGIAGGIISGFDALEKGTNFWTGKSIFDVSGAMGCNGCLPKDINIGGKIKAKYVGSFEGQNVFESKLLGTLSYNENYSGFTLPDVGIFVGKGVFTLNQQAGLAMMQHEFGHVLQYRIVGFKNYYEVIAKESLLNCAADRLLGTSTHNTFWTETWANYLSKNYFGTKWLGEETLSGNNGIFYYPSKNISNLRKIISFDIKPDIRILKSINPLFNFIL